jgi:SAM-dependent methyltransferase
MPSLLKRLYQNAGLAYYFLFLGPRGAGRPILATKLDAQYSEGIWDRNFESPDEIPRYAIVASYIRRRATPPSVLDVGAGNGRLVADLHLGDLKAYLGTDISAEATAQARERYPHANVEFEVADFEDGPPEGEYDVIVFNDALYYARDPVAVLERYAARLTPDGALIVVMFRHRNTMVIWKQLARRFEFLNTVEVTDRKGELTDIRILRRLP